MKTKRSTWDGLADAQLRRDAFGVRWQAKRDTALADGQPGCPDFFGDHPFPAKAPATLRSAGALHNTTCVRPAPPLSSARSRAGGFTLLEMLTVIGIIGLLAALIGPNLGNFKPNVVSAATQQLLTDVGRARLLATSQRTTVYMVFVPPGFWNDTAFQAGFGTSTDYANAYPLLEKQLTGYNFVSLRSIGDQPGRHSPHYLSSWKTLPDGTYINTNKFNNFNTGYPYYYLYTNNPAKSEVDIFGTFAPFSNTVSIPFPTELTPLPSTGRYTTLPCIAFNYLGQLVNPLTGNLAVADELIPIAKGSVMYARDSVTRTNKPPAIPNVVESPAGGSVTNSFSVVRIERLTGRARVMRQEVK